MDPKKLQTLLDQARNELTLLYELGNALRTTLELNETLSIILKGVTSRKGLGFNRAAFFFVNEVTHQLQGRLGVTQADADGKKPLSSGKLLVRDTDMAGHILDDPVHKNIHHSIHPADREADDQSPEEY